MSFDRPIVEKLNHDGSTTHHCIFEGISWLRDETLTGHQRRPLTKVFDADTDEYATANLKWWHILESGDTKEKLHTRTKSGGGEVVPPARMVGIHAEQFGLPHSIEYDWLGDSSSD